MSIINNILGIISDYLALYLVLVLCTVQYIPILLLPYCRAKVSASQLPPWIQTQGRFGRRITHSFSVSNPDTYIHFAYLSVIVDWYKSLLLNKPIIRQQQQETLSDCLDLAAYRAEYKRDQQERKNSADGDDDDDKAANQIDWHDFIVAETIGFAVNETVTEPLAPQPQSQSTTAWANRMTMTMTTKKQSGSFPITPPRSSH